MASRHYPTKTRFYVVRKFNSELRRNYAQQLRDEKALELGIQKVVKGRQAQIDFLKGILETLGVEYRRTSHG